MIKNYIKIAFRKLVKYKLDSVISIGGLAVGIACCILLVLSVRFELTYDNFHENGDRIYRVTQTNLLESGETNYSAVHPYPLASALDSAYPEIQYTVQLQRGQLQIMHGDKFYNEQILMAGTDFFQVFSFPFVAGNETTALMNPRSMVLSESMAESLFGETQVLGEVVTVRGNNEEYAFRVTAVARDVPENSSIKFDIIVPIETMFLGEPVSRQETFKQSWYIGNNFTWLMLNENASVEALAVKMAPLLETYMGSLAEDMKLGLQPLDEVYFSQEYQGLAESTEIQYTLILAGLALVIVVIAGMNFMSLTLSRISGRKHEIGIRKAAGAERKQLGYQLVGEILITCSIALFMGVLLAELLSPYFQHVTQKPVHPGLFNDPVAWVMMLAVIPLITLVTGIYPAFVISRGKASTLFGSHRTASRIPSFVKGLTVAQFTLSVAFLIATIVMQGQLNFMITRDVGFTPDNVISLEFSVQDEQRGEIATLFRDQARNLPDVEDASLTDGRYNLQLSRSGDMTSRRSVTSLEGFEDSHLIIQYVDEYYLGSMDIELIEGRNFSLDRQADIQNGIIVNQRFVDVVGLQNPIGHIIVDRNESYQGPMEGKQIIGVVEDFNFQALYNTLQPLALQHLDSESSGQVGTILVKTESAIFGQTVERLNELWNSMLPEQPFSYAFLDDLLESQYQSEKQWSSIMQFASAIAILLACFGLFGMVALITERRTKEIGIRKVLGATVTNIVTLLNKDFMKLVLLGFVIAVPIAWYAMNRWLQDFAYRIDIGLGIFAIAGVVALLIALATVSWQSVRAALANPVESLRTE